jgi:hypothetical protein
MAFPNESPYDILEISPSARLQEIMKAFADAQRLRRHTAPKLTQAFNNLRNPRKRAEHDLFVFMNLGDTATIDSFMASIAKPALVEATLEPIPISPLLPILQAPLSQEFTPLPPSEIALQNTSVFDQLELTLPPLTFPV